MDTTFYLETGSADPAYNLAFEEFVQANRTDGNYLILWQNRSAVIIGRNQNAEAEICRSFVEEHGIDVVRRNTGGGAVYHDLGNLNYSFITDAADPSQRTASAFTSPVVQALKALGLDAQASGRNDILVSGHKVSGTAEHLLQGRLLHHGTLLFDSDLSMVSGALNPDPTKFQSKSVQSVRGRVGNIRSFLPKDMDLQAFWDHIKHSLSQQLTPVRLNANELAEIETLKKSKYDTWAWNFGKSPQYAQQLRRRFSGGLLELHLTVQKGLISDFRIYGDFLGLTPVGPLENALLGCPYREDTLRERIAHFPFNSCLGSITAEEFLCTLLQKDKEAS